MKQERHELIAFSYNRYCTKRSPLLNRHPAHIESSARMYLCGCMPGFRLAGTNRKTGPNGFPRRKAGEGRKTKSFWRKLTRNWLVAKVP